MSGEVREEFQEEPIERQRLPYENNDLTAASLPFEDIISVVSLLDKALLQPFIRIFILSLSGTGISTKEMKTADKFKSFCDLFQCLYQQKNNLQDTVDFTCYVLDRFKCTGHREESHNLQQYASSKPYDIHPEVDHRLLILETLYNKNQRQRRKALVAMAAKHLYLSHDRIDCASILVLKMCERGNAPIGQPVPGLGKLDKKASKWKDTYENPPDDILSKNRFKTYIKKFKKELGISAIIMMLLVIIALIFWCIAFPNSSHPSSPVTVSINNSNRTYPVLLNPEGFFQDGSIKLTTTSSSVSIHQMDCNLIVTSNKTLTPPTRLEFTERLVPGRGPINYYTREPVRLVPESNITVTLSSSYTTEHLPVPQDDNCLKLFLFDSLSESDKFEYHELAIIVNNSSCLPVGTLSDPLINVTTFPIMKQGTYYLQVQFPRHIAFNVTIEVFQVRYDITNATAICNDGFSPTQPCIIQTCGSSKFCFHSRSSQTCLFGSLNDESDSGNVTYEVTPSSYQRGHGIMIIIGGASAGIWAIICLIVVAYSLCFCVFCF